MEHTFRITCKGKTKLLSVKGTQEYALSYISGYVQALRDRFGLLTSINVQSKDKYDVNPNIDQWN